MTIQYIFQKTPKGCDLKRFVRGHWRLQTLDRIFMLFMILMSNPPHVNLDPYLNVLLGHLWRNSSNIHGTADMPGDVASLSSVLQHRQPINY